jgi:hypothetical protein
MVYPPNHEDRGGPSDGADSPLMNGGSSPEDKPEEEEMDLIRYAAAV